MGQPAVGHLLVFHPPQCAPLPHGYFLCVSYQRQHRPFASRPFLLSFKAARAATLGYADGQGIVYLPPVHTVEPPLFNASLIFLARQRKTEGQAELRERMRARFRHTI